METALFGTAIKLNSAVPDEKDPKSLTWADRPS